MSVINTNIPSLIAQRHLSQSQGSLSTTLERLSSGLRINRGSDDAAGLIISERLRSQIAAVTQAVENSNRAINVIATAEAALDEVSALLIDIQALVLEAANEGAFSEEEVAANQLQIDSAIDSISRIAQTAAFGGQKLLDGQLGYLTSGVDATAVADLDIFAAKFGTADSISVEVEVTTSARKAELFFTSANVGGSGITLDIAGPEGIITLTFPASATSVDIVEAINANTDATGVEAVASGVGGSAGLVIQSLEYGSDAFVSVTTIEPSGDFPLVDRDGITSDRSEGIDAEATINGSATVADGLKLSVSNSNLKLDLILDEGFGTGTTEFVVTGGGALFQVGPEAGINNQENIGIRSVHANKLGNALTGYLAELRSGQPNALRAGNFKEATDIVKLAIDQITVLRGRLGAFQRNTLESNINQLTITSENLTAAESNIRDADFAVETSELTRSQILVQAGTSVLAIANAQAQNVLTLLGG